MITALQKDYEKDTGQGTGTEPCQTQTKSPINKAQETQSQVIHNNFLKFW